MLIAHQIDDGHKYVHRQSIVRSANRDVCESVMILYHYYLLGCTCCACERSHYITTPPLPCTARASVPCVAKCQRRRCGRRAVRLYRCARSANAAREIGACTVQQRACARATTLARPNHQTTARPGRVRTRARSRFFPLGRGVCAPLVVVTRVNGHSHFRTYLAQPLLACVCVYVCLFV